MIEAAEQNAEIATPSFADTTGKEYFPRLDYQVLDTIRAKVGLDLANAERIGSVWTDLVRSDAKALQVVWLALGEDDAPSAEWLSAMDGPALESAVTALANAVYLFSRPSRRQLFVDGIEAVNKAYREAVEQAGVQIQAALNSTTARVKSAR